MKPKKILDSNQLEYFYNEKKLSQEKTADAMECDRIDIRNNLKYYNIDTRNPDEARELVSNWNKGLTKETDERIATYAKKISETRKGMIPWNKDKIYNEKILIKILQRQSSISCEYNLAAFGYSKKTISPNSAIVWVFRKYENARARKLRKANPQKVIEYRKEYYKLHKENLKKKVSEYQKTSEGKLTAARSSNTHSEKGFVPLNEKSEMVSDWHHIHPKLPFVVSIDRKKHRAHLGKKHHDLANSATGWNIFIDKNFETTTSEYVESIVELNYPSQFRDYWFGNY